MALSRPVHSAASVFAGRLPWHREGARRGLAGGGQHGLAVGCGRCEIRLLSVVQRSPQDFYDKLPEADDDENDMLDLAFGLTDT